MFQCSSNLLKEFTELGEAFERKYSGYSGGMKSKLGFGFISDLRSEILLIDETFGAGDREFKKKSRVKMNAMVDEIPTVVMCSHGLSLVASVCNREDLFLTKGLFPMTDQSERQLSITSKLLRIVSIGLSSNIRRRQLVKAASDLISKRNLMFRRE